MNLVTGNTNDLSGVLAAQNEASYNVGIAIYTLQQIGAQFLGRNENVFEFGSVAKTLTSILEDSNSPNVIDFLSLDVEGAELDVLRGIDFGRYNFKYMLIEIRDFDRIDSFLKQFKYRFVEKFSSHDYLFKYFGEN